MSVWTKRRRRALRVSAYLPNWTNGLALGGQPRWAQLVEAARSLEEMGIDGIWVADQLLQEFEEHEPLAFWESWTVISALAPLTSEVTLGPLVASAGFRNPGLLANMAATLAEISSGRVAVGLGAGYDEREHRAFGFPWDAKVTRLAEAAAVLDDLLHGRASSRSGRFYSTDQAQLEPWRSAPLVIGTYTPGPRMLKIVAEHADAWSAWLAFDHNSADVMTSQLSAVQDACAVADRNPESLHRIACVSIQTTSEPFRFGPLDIGAVAFRGTPQAIADELRTFEGVADEVALYTFPLTAFALESLGEILRLLEK